MMVRFLYTKILTLPTAAVITPGSQTVTGNIFGGRPSPVIETSADLLLCTKTYIMADQFAIAALKVAAKVKYEESLPAGWNSMAFSSSLVLMFESTLEKDRMLKDVAIRYAAKKAATLRNRGEFMTMCKQNAEICFDILSASLPLHIPRGCPWYGKCHDGFIIAGKTKEFMCKANNCNRKEFDGIGDD